MIDPGLESCAARPDCCSRPKQCRIRLRDGVDVAAPSFHCRVRRVDVRAPGAQSATVSGPAEAPGKPRENAPWTCQRTRRPPVPISPDEAVEVASVNGLTL